jgi:hypothetical protein
MYIRFTQFRALTLAVLALGTTLRAEDSEAPKKKPSVEAPKVQPAPKVISPKVVFSTALSEMLATNLTVAPGAYQSLTAKTDFTGADNVNLGFFGANGQDFTKTTYTIWWAIPNSPSFVATFFYDGSNFAFTNSGGFDVYTFGNQLMVGIQNNGTNPVTYSVVTAWANAR